ncbi:Stk1 family PASTA domain-containing Ser/Thr kinase [Butyricicoccus sp.]|uniref:Stk1 family PASTA domain-containing Ser/Thr kinase n=1 Tax=Butyricicoccus sp. TaxID=2049021 RepID=UPI003F14E097
MENLIGQTLGGRYEVREVIGTGGMAVVYKAYCTVLNRYVAIKVLKEEYAQDEEFRKRFYNEAQAVAKLSQNNIVAIYDVCHADNSPEYIVMELCEGVTLKDYLRKKHHLTWQETLYFAQQVARALDHAHSRGIIHQDIKPQNIMLLRDGTAKVMDFGIASFANSQETRKVSSEAIGSVHYISPEQAKGITADFRTDLYSLGVVMYEMLTGTLPFRGETAVAVVMQHLNTVPPVPSSIVPEIPQAMDEIVMHAMCANVNQRYSSALDMFRDMERLRTNPNLQLHYSTHNNDLDATRAIKYDAEEATQYMPRIQDEDEQDATQYVPRTEAAASSGSRSAGNNRVYKPAYDQDDEYEQDRPIKPAPRRKKGNGGKVVVGVIIVALLAAIAYLGSGLLGGGSDEMVSVPNFIGMNYTEEIKNNSEYDSFTFRIIEEQDTSGDYEDGEVMEQDPEADTEVKEGTKITLTIAEVDNGDKGDETMVAVPSIIGKSYENAQSALRAAGLNVSRTEQSSETIAEGYVISCDPDVGTQVATGSTVNVVVSTGSANTNKTVPNLTGLTQDQAKAALEKVGLKLGSVTEEESSAQAGTVINQTVPYGTEVAAGTAVGITIAKSAEEQQPDEPDQPQGSGTASADVTSSLITIHLPTDRDTCRITVSVDGSILRNDTVKTSRGTTTCRVSYSGVHRVTVTVDGEAIYDKDFDFG